MNHDDSFSHAVLWGIVCVYIYIYIYIDRERERERVWVVSFTLSL